MQRLYALINIAQALKKNELDQAIGRSQGGLTTKIHATCDALGNPTGFYLTAGQVHDLEGADVLLENIQAEALLADFADDARERVLQRLETQKCQPVIPPKSNRQEQRSYDQEQYRSSSLD